MANAINFIDGLDGLAAGIVAIAAGTFFLYAMQLADEGVLQDGNIGPLIADHRARDVPRVPAVERAPGHGSSWATAARCCSAC